MLSAPICDVVEMKGSAVDIKNMSASSRHSGRIFGKPTSGEDTDLDWVATVKRPTQGPKATGM